MSALKGDFIGFTFNGYHSSDLGIIRVSDGSRYSESLLPTIQDKTVQVPGADGTYYFGSFYTQRPFNISVAFDNMSEVQLRQLKEVFGDKGIRDFIFDEVPYKIYRVKSTGTPNLKYICFNKDEDEFDRDYQVNNEIQSKEELYGIGSRSPFGRVYKGEGQLNFVAYEPFARSRYKYIDQYTVQNVPEWGSMDTAAAEDVHYNLYDWVDSARLRRSDAALTFSDKTYTLDVVDTNGVAYYNAGDLPVHFTLQLIGTSIPSIIIKDEVDESKSLSINGFTLEEDDEGVRINGQLNLIEGLRATDEFKKVDVTSGRNPKQEGWYEISGDTYIATQDETPDSTKKYYEVIYEPTGVIYNRYISAGDFFKLEPTTDLQFLYITGTNNDEVLDSLKAAMQYEYLYY